MRRWLRPPKGTRVSGGPKKEADVGHRCRPCRTGTRVMFNTDLAVVRRDGAPAVDRMHEHRGMLLAPLEQRQKEIAVRLALGSSSGRLLRQFLVENLLLCTAGGSIGVLAGSWLLRGLLVLLPFALPASAPVQIDAQVLVFSLAVAIATALMFSLAPLLTSTRMDVNETLRSAGRSIAGGSARQPSTGRPGGWRSGVFSDAAGCGGAAHSKLVPAAP